MMKWQVGQFLILLGFMGLIVFFVTDQVKSPDYLFFCSGLLVIILGITLMWQGRNPPPPAERFRIFRRKEKPRSDETKK